MDSNSITFLQSLEISLLSMFVVFIILISLSFFVSLLSKFSKEKKNDLSKETISKVDASIDENGFIHNFDEIEDEDMLAAILVASIDASNEDKDATVRIKSVRRV